MELFSKTVQFRGTRTRILIILEPFVIMVDFALFFFNWTDRLLFSGKNRDIMDNQRGTRTTHHLNGKKCQAIPPGIFD